MKAQLSLLAATLAFPLASSAAGKVVLEMTAEQGSQQSTIEFDGGRMRMNMPASQNGETYMVLRDGHLYSVINQGGQPMVLDLNALSGMLGNTMQQNVDIGGGANSVFSLEDTGRSETVAGIEGHVYLATYSDDGNTKTDEIVVGKSAALREFTQGLTAWTQAISQSFGVASGSGDDGMELLLQKGDGVLRFGNSYRVVSLNDASFAGSRFELPAAPTSPLDAAQDNQTASGPQSAVGGFFGGILNRQAERQQDRAESRADQAEQEVDQKVDRTIDKALNGLFGR